MGHRKKLDFFIDNKRKHFEKFRKYIQILFLVEFDHIFNWK